MSGVHSGWARFYDEQDRVYINFAPIEMIKTMHGIGPVTSKKLSEMRTQRPLTYWSVQEKQGGPLFLRHGWTQERVMQTFNFRLYENEPELSLQPGSHEISPSLDLPQGSSTPRHFHSVSGGERHRGQGSSSRQERSCPSWYPQGADQMEETATKVSQRNPESEDRERAQEWEKLEKKLGDMIENKLVGILEAMSLQRDSRERPSDPKRSSEGCHPAVQSRPAPESNRATGSETGDRGELGDKMKNLPSAITFEGASGTWERFEMDLEAFFRVYRIRENESKIFSLQVALKGPAREHLSTVQKLGIHDFDYILSKLRERYKKKEHTSSAKLTLYRMKQPADTSDEQWANEVEKAVFLAMPEIPAQFLERQVIDRFCSSLNDEALHMHMTAHHFNTMAEALDAASQFRESRTFWTQQPAVRTVSFRAEDASAVRTVQSPRSEGDSFRVGMEQTAMTNLIQELTQQMKELGQRLDSRPSRRELGGRSRSQSPSSCFRCGGRGHLARDCATPSGNERGATFAA